MTNPSENPPSTYHAPGGVRLDQFLTAALHDVSRASVQRWIREGAVLIDGQPARASDKPEPHQTITLDAPQPPPLHLQPEAMPLSIVYEDEDLLVVDKSAGITVHPGAGAHSGTLAHGLLAYTQQLSAIGGDERPGIVHRLDRNTSGLLVVARNNASHRRLQAQIAAKTAGREYVAIAWGSPAWDHAVVRAAIGRDPRHRTRMTIVPEEEGGRSAETSLDVEERLGAGCVLKATLTTGRTHQIRVHCAFSNLPLVGDPVYGDPQRAGNVRDPRVREELQKIERQALHARYLSFRHPRTNLFMEFRSNPPEDWMAILSLVRRASETHA